jgi:tetratricopeptide (TPR) repeat protein
METGTLMRAATPGEPQSAAPATAAPAVEAAFERMHLAATTGDPVATMRNVSTGTVVLQEYRPLHEALEWRISELYWTRQGVQPFSASEVPFVVTSSGRLSEHAAAILFASCLASAPDAHFAVLELGAGTGLFARYFLDAFRGICEQEARDFYSRLTYVVSDRSMRSVQDWMERGLFDDHEGHIVLATGDATDPRALAPTSSGVRVPDRFRAIFCNYVLDVLPATVVRRVNGRCEELRVRTKMSGDERLLRQRVQLEAEEVRSLAERTDTAEYGRLLPLLDLIEVEAAFQAYSSLPPTVEEVLDSCPERAVAVVNHGAVACLERCASLLESDGWILVNDYGPVRSEEVAEQALTQRFGSTSAIGLDFSLLEALLARRGLEFVEPEGDADRALHSRLVLRDRATAAAAAFADRFGADGQRYFEEPVQLARQHAAAGRNDEALDHFRTAIERNARDWSVLGEVAEFVGLHLREFGAGIELARAAVAQNPWYSPWLWNVLGDCLFCLDRFGDAHEAYLEAQRIDRSDVRTNLNLAFTLSHRGDYDDALQAIARALARDGAGHYQSRLLEQQQRILGEVTRRWTERQESLARRAGHLRAAAALTPFG